ncbi:NlpC/P60 family protein [Candidatus Kapabacteria bacterium]|nr:NlpC/P60 family protein [Candidatus Kapabacteria bacterium]
MKSQNTSQYFLVIFLVLSLFATDLIAGRQSRKERKKVEAIKIIQENSEEVSILAGVDPLSNDSLAAISIEENQVGDLGEDPLELANDEDTEIDFESFNMLWLAFVAEDEEDTFTENGIHKEELMDFVMDWLGTPYRFGGDSKRSIDCSAFTRRAFRTALDVELPRTAVYQYQFGQEISKDELELGDMIFFKTRRYAAITHVGIYLGDNLFAHASSSHGVTVSKLAGYYERKYKGARRLTLEDFRKLEVVSDDDDVPPFKVGG